MTDIYVIPVQEFKEDAEASNLALRFLSATAIRIWMYGLTSEPEIFHKINSEYFLDETGLKETEIEVAIQELKKKKYLTPLDEEAGVWWVHSYPQIKGGWKHGK